MFLHAQDGLNLLNECFYTPPRSSCTLVAHATEKLVHRRHTPQRSSCTQIGGTWPDFDSSEGAANPPDLPGVRGAPHLAFTRLSYTEHF